MSITTQRHLNFIADVLEGLLRALWQDAKDGMATVKTDAVWGKAKYRKRARQPRQPRVVRERVIIRPSAPRVYVVDKRK